MSQLLPYKDFRFTNAVKLKQFLENDDSAETGYFVDVDQNIPREIGKQTRNFTFCPENKMADIDNICFS